MPESRASKKPSTDAPAAPAGWYPTLAGGHRYWDGQAWTNLPWDESLAGETSSGKESRPRRRAVWWIVGGVVLLALLVIGGIAIATGIENHNASVAAAQHAAAVKEKAKEAAEAKKLKDDNERAARKAAIPGIEASVKTLATKDVDAGLLDGPILSVSCSPVGGGSTDDLSELTTVFQCFVADLNNADGTQSGYYFNATMNWSTGQYTYGLGKPNG